MRANNFNKFRSLCLVDLFFDFDSSILGHMVYFVQEGKSKLHLNSKQNEDVAYCKFNGHFYSFDFSYLGVNNDRVNKLKKNGIFYPYFSR